MDASSSHLEGGTGHAKPKPCAKPTPPPLPSGTGEPTPMDQLRSSGQSKKPPPPLPDSYFGKAASVIAKDPPTGIDWNAPPVNVKPAARPGLTPPPAKADPAPQCNAKGAALLKKPPPKGLFKVNAAGDMVDATGAKLGPHMHWLAHQVRPAQWQFVPKQLPADVPAKPPAKPPMKAPPPNIKPGGHNTRPTPDRLPFPLKAIPEEAARNVRNGAAVVITDWIYAPVTVTSVDPQQLMRNPSRTFPGPPLNPNPKPTPPAKVQPTPKAVPSVPPRRNVVEMFSICTPPGTPPVE